MPLVFCVILCRGLALSLIPKAASTSVALAVQNSARSSAVRVHRDHVPQSAFVAAFLRHPAARLVSAWAGIVLRQDQTTHAWSRLKRLGYYGNMSFEEFAARTCRCVRRDKHLVPQVQFLPQRISFVGRVENMKADWTRLQARFRWLSDLDTLNQSEHDDWSIYYSEPLLNRVLQFYAADYARWQAARPHTRRHRSRITA